jgi:hypothetical protein
VERVWNIKGEVDYSISEESMEYNLGEIVFNSGISYLRIISSKYCYSWKIRTKKRADICQDNGIKINGY